MGTDVSRALMLADLGPDLRYTFASPAYAKVLGTTPEDIIGQHPQMYLTSETYANAEPHLRRALSGESVHYSLDVRSLPNTLERVEIWYQPEFDETGRVFRIRSAIFDVSSHEKARGEVDILATRLRAAHRLSPDGFFVFKSIRADDGRIVDFEWEYANEAGAKIAQRAREDLVGSCMLEVLPGNREEGLFDAYREVTETGVPFTTVVEYRHDGLNIWVEITAIKLGDGFAVAFRDVTESQRRAADLRDNEARLRIAVEATKLGIWDLDPVADTAERSLRHDQIFGYPNGVEPWGMERFLTHVVPRDRDRIRSAMVTASELKLPLQFKTQIKTAQGEDRWIHVHGENFSDDEGQIVRQIGTIEDITKEVLAERRRNVLVRELNHRVKNTLAMVQAISRQTQRSTDSVSDFEMAFNARLQAIAAAHDILIESDTGAADVASMIERQVRPYAPNAKQLQVTGDDVALSPEAAHNLGLVLHELATNAAKYGALSSPGGKVTLRTARLTDDHVRIEWQESSGPPVMPPKHRGFGSRLIKQSIEFALGGDCDMDFAREGLRVRLEFPVLEVAVSD